MLSAIAKQRIEDTTDSLIGSGYRQIVTDSLKQMLTTAVTSGMSYNDMLDQIQTALLGAEDKPGMISKYAKTYVTDTLGQFAGQGNKLIATALDSQWFQYVGSNLTTTREFCEHLTKKRYVHISEIPTILKGEIDGHKCKINEATGLWLGAKDGTNEDNFIVNRGGWNCGHELIPVNEAVVPRAVKDKLEYPRKADTSSKVVETLSPPAFTEVIEKLEIQGIDFFEVKDLEKPLSEDEIIARVGGGDLTQGSCSSLALTYLGNVCGFDVQDFRDGISRKFFANKNNIQDIVKRIGGKLESDTSDFHSAVQLLKQVVPGKEYYFSCGRHAAVVRKLESGVFEYLELQSPTENGFKRLTTSVLGNRFDARKSHTLLGTKYETTSTLIDIDLLKKDASFRKLLGYINTQADQQKKGDWGTIK
ncbi:MAG: hypothetical protein LBR67_01855 [Dysgonamonadaceae bacterium]|jgi:hypothetical protein|nr:hypothetical protein [Dysgonamonadaceae bacterium]